jgi:hypothetical protein
MSQYHNKGQIHLVHLFDIVNRILLKGIAVPEEN